MAERMADFVDNAARLADRKGGELEAKIAKCERSLKALMENETVAMRTIVQTMEALRVEVRERERALKQRVAAEVESRRHLLQKQLDDLTQLRDDCENSSQVARALLKSTMDSSSGPFDSMYLVGAADTVDGHVDELSEAVDVMIASLTEVDTSVFAVFAEEDVNDVRLAIRSLGIVNRSTSPVQTFPPTSTHPPDRTTRSIYFTLTVGLFP